MAYTDSLTMGSSQGSHLWMVYGYICRNGNSIATILLGVRICITPCTPHGRCGLTMGLGVYRLKSVELRCRLRLLFDSTFSCSSTASPDISLACTLHSIPGPAQVSLVAACGAAAWIHELHSVKKWTTHSSAPHVATLVLKALKASHAHLPIFKIAILLFPCGNYNSVASQKPTMSINISKNDCHVCMYVWTCICATVSAIKI